MVGKSTLGSVATGNFEKPRSPSSAMASISSVVATGREINTAEKFIVPFGRLRFYLRFVKPVLNEDAEAGAQVPRKEPEHTRKTGPLMTFGPEVTGRQIRKRLTDRHGPVNSYWADLNPIRSHPLLRKV